VRGAGARSSERDATQSSEGRREAEVEVLEAEDTLAMEGDCTGEGGRE
jgi:hypothetical protein